MAANYKLFETESEGGVAANGDQHPSIPVKHAVHMKKNLRKPKAAAEQA